MRLAITLPLSVVAGLSTGFAIFRAPHPAASPTPNAVRVSENATQSTATSDSNATTDAKTQRLITAALRKGNSNERENEVYLAIEALNADDFPRLLGNDAAFKAMIEKIADADWPTGPNLISGLIGRWLEVDRDAVIAWAPHALDLFTKEESADNWLLNLLSARIPEEMLALVSSRKEAKERTNIIKNAIPKLVAKDLSKARAWVANLTDPNDRREAETALQRGTVEVDPLLAIEMAESTKSRSDANNLLYFAAQSAAKMGPGILRQLVTMPMKPWMTAPLINELAERDPDLAVELVMKSRSDGYDASPSLCTAFAAMARRDPSLCMAKLEELKGRERAAAISTIGYNWASNDPAAALSWLMQQPVSERSSYHIGSSGTSNDTVVMGFSDWIQNAPAEARAWADALPPNATRDQLQIEVARVLATRGEYGEATRVLANLGKDVSPNAVAQVASTWARRDPRAAAEWAIAQEPGTAQSRALAGIVGTWADDDQAGVENWLAQFPPGETRDRSVKEFLFRRNSWTTTREQRTAEFDAWFGYIDDPWQRAQVARSSFRQRKLHDPAAARAWLSSLQNVDPEIIRTILRDNAD